MLVNLIKHFHLPHTHRCHDPASGARWWSGCLGTPCDASWAGADLLAAARSWKEWACHWRSRERSPSPPHSSHTDPRVWAWCWVGPSHAPAWCHSSRLSHACCKVCRCSLLHGPWSPESGEILVITSQYRSQYLDSQICPRFRWLELDQRPICFIFLHISIEIIFMLIISNPFMWTMSAADSQQQQKLLSIYNLVFTPLANERPGIWLWANGWGSK